MDISALLRPKRREPVRGELLTPMAAAGAAVSGEDFYIGRKAFPTF